MAILGKRNSLTILRAGTPGLFLDGGPLGDILLPRRYIPQNLADKTELNVFVYRDSEDRLVATTENPLAMVGEFAALRVISVNSNIGAFLDWGLPKDLLLPFREQEGSVRAGDRVVVHVALDPKSNRILASMRLRRYLSKDTPMYRNGQAVNLTIVRRTPLGYEALVENAHLGQLYNDTVGAPLIPGQTLKGFVRTVLPNNKIDLRLDAAGYHRVAPLGDQIIQALETAGGRLAVDDDTSPDQIRRDFGVSKKAFKQALGKLYKSRHIEFTKPGIALLKSP